MIRNMQISPCMARSEVVILQNKMMISIYDMYHKHILLMEKVPDMGGICNQKFTQSNMEYFLLFSKLLSWVFILGFSFGTKQ